MNSDDHQDQDKLARARLAMSPEEKKEEWQKREEYLVKRKKEAALAMASAEQKTAQEAASKAVIDKIQAQKKLAELELTRKTEEAKKKKTIGNEQAVSDLEAEKQKRQRIDELLNAQTEIKEITHGQSSHLSPIKTLTRDMANTIEDDRLSAASLIVKAKASQLDENSGNSEEKSKIKIYLVASLGLIILGLATIGFVWWQKIIQENTAVTEKHQPIIFADRQQVIDLTGQNPTQIATSIKKTIDQLRQELITKEFITDIYFTEKINQIVDGKNLSQTIGVGAGLFLASSTPATAYNLGRFLDNDFMLGIYRGYDLSAFFIFRVNDYKSVADALLRDGPEIIADLYGLTNGETVRAAIIDGQVKDLTVKNFDLRVIKNNIGETLALYSFLDHKTLLIAKNEEFFQKILTAYLTPRTSGG